MRTLPYRLTWPEIVRLYRLALDTPAHNTQHLPTTNINTGDVTMITHYAEIIYHSAGWPIAAVAGVFAYAVGLRECRDIVNECWREGWNTRPRR